MSSRSTTGTMKRLRGGTMSDTHSLDSPAEEPAAQSPIGAELPRRDFIRNVAVGAVGLALGARAASAGVPSTASSYSRILGANDRVRVGIVGYSDRFRQAHLPVYAKIAKEENFEIVALSDIWSKRRDEGIASIGTATGSTVRPFRNNE